MSNRNPAAEINRQINFQIKMKDRALTEYMAKVTAIDAKIAFLEEQAEALSE